MNNRFSVPSAHAQNRWFNAWMASGLQTKILAFTTALVLVVMLVLSAFLYRRVDSLSRAQTAQDMGKASQVFQFFLNGQMKNLMDRFQSVIQEPRLKAGLLSDDADTLAALLNDLQKETHVSFLLVMDRRGKTKSIVTSPTLSATAVRDLAVSFRTQALERSGGVSPALADDRLVLCAALPVRMGEEVVGALLVGEELKDQTAQTFKGLTDMDIALLAGGRLMATSFDAGVARPEIEHLFSKFTSTNDSHRLGGAPYAVALRPLELVDDKTAAVYGLLKPLRMEQRYRRSLALSISSVAIFGVLLAFWGVAGFSRWLTRPILSVSSSIDEIADATDRASRDSSAAFGQLNRMIRDTAAHADSVSRAAKTADGLRGDAATHIVSGTEEIKRLTNHLMEIKDLIGGTTATIDSLAQKSVQIGKIMTFIKRIAGQTKLLSLNARIEAIHAGEAGKSFGVVANEIRALAEESEKSILEIGHLTSDILEATSESVNQVRSSKERVEKSDAIVRSVEDRFTQLTDSLSQISERLGEINGLSAQSTDATREATIMGESLSSTFGQVVANAKVLTAAADRLENLVKSTQAGA